MGLILQSLETADLRGQAEALHNFAAIRDGWQPGSLSEARTLAQRFRLFLPSALKTAGIEFDPMDIEYICRTLEDGDFLLYGYQYAEALEDAVALPEGA